MRALSPPCPNPAIPAADYRYACRLLAVLPKRAWRATRGHYWVDKELFASTAALALWQAARQWDPARRVRFSSWAYTRIWCALMEDVRQQSLWCRSQGEERRRLENAGEELPGPLRPPLFLEHALSQQASRKGDDAALLVEVLAAPAVDPQAAALATVEAEAVRAALPALPSLERYVVERRLWDGATLREISREIGRSESRALQVYQQALRRLADLLGPALEGAAP